MRRSLRVAFFRRRNAAKPCLPVPSGLGRAGQRRGDMGMDTIARAGRFPGNESSLGARLCRSPSSAPESGSEPGQALLQDTAPDRELLRQTQGVPCHRNALRQKRPKFPRRHSACGSYRLAQLTTGSNMPKSGGPERIGLRRAISGHLHVWPVNRSTQKTPGNLPLSAASGQAESTARMGTGGGGAPGFERSPLPAPILRAHRGSKGNRGKMSLAGKNWMSGAPYVGRLFAIIAAR
ncbi:hypothetical protein C8P66_10416 [Humitalea rosea]|uniref:Uncharacterized protein n=1 Tax=Humitalea rosea TaxID=990373 RepID=A0A2W7J9C0_9PROT|nr:hypothetical protein C8P66_10416 [Humitalea rosea]